jgi:hypothetical protein
MNVPPYMKRKIISCAKHNAIAKQQDEDIRAFLTKCNLNGYGTDVLIDCVELTNDPKSLIRFIENDGDGIAGNCEDYTQGDYNLRGSSHD